MGVILGVLQEDLGVCWGHLVGTLDSFLGFPGVILGLP